MVKRLKSKLLLGPGEFNSTDDRMKVVGVFNPGAARFGEDIVLLVRVAEAPVEKEDGWLLSPRVVRDGGQHKYEIDRLEIAAGGGADHRKPTLVSGRLRLAFVSHLEVVTIDVSGYCVKSIETREGLFGIGEYEEYGVEDPRITEIEGGYYITYVSVSGAMGVCTSLMKTQDFESFERLGIIFPCENKDVVLFPEKIGGRYHCFHRPVGRIPISDLAIVHADSPDLRRWGNHRRVLSCSGDAAWYRTRIGGGAPPIRVDEGWLSIFHGVRQQVPDDPIGEYTGGALLSAADDPGRVIAVSEEPFFRAETDYELKGYVNNVVFPTGVVRGVDDDGCIHIYYGCADSCVAVATFSVREIIGSLKAV